MTGIDRGGTTLSLAQLLADARRRRGWSTRALADAMGASGYPIRHQRVSAYEHGTMPPEDYCAVFERVVGAVEGSISGAWRDARAERLAHRRRRFAASTAEQDDAESFRTSTRSRPRWEYRVRGQADVESLNDELARAEQGGWDVVAVTALPGERMKARSDRLLVVYRKEVVPSMSEERSSGA